MSWMFPNVIHPLEYCSVIAHLAGYLVVPVVELIDILDVSKHNIVLVYKARRDVL